MENAGRYNIIAELGRGASGVVFKAHDRHLDRLVAIKSLSPSPAASKHLDRVAEMFFREARTTARLLHAGVVEIYDIFEDPGNGSPCMVMEFVGGGTLAATLAARKPSAPDGVLDLARQIAEALEYAHSNRFLHLDLKPANILMTQEGRPKITDFGLATFLGRVGGIVTESLNGTPAYMAPERVQRGKVDERSDLFSLGVILYEMLTGQAPFRGELSSVLFGIVNEEPAPPSHLNPALGPQYDALAARCLAKDPAQRVSSACEFLQRLAALPQPASTRSLNTSAAVIASSQEPAKSEETKERATKRPASKSGTRPRTSKGSKKKSPAWVRAVMPYLPQRAARAGGLLLLSMALAGEVWTNFRGLRPETASAAARRAVGSASRMDQTSVLGTSSLPSLQDMSVSLRAAAAESRSRVESFRANLSNAVLSGSKAAESERPAKSALPRRSSRARNLKQPAGSASQVFTPTPNSSWPGFGSSLAAGYELPPAGDDARPPNWAASILSGSANLAGMDSESAPDDLPQAQERVRFICDYDLHEGALTVSLNGKEAFRETLRARKQTFLGIGRSSQGLVSRVLLVPADTRNISVEISSSDKSLVLDDVTGVDLPGRSRTLRATIRGRTLHLAWDPAQPLAASSPGK